MKYIFILISLLVSLKSHGQIDIVNRSLTDSTLNFLYIGVDNAIEIKGLKCPQCTVTISRGGSTIQLAGQNRYIARVSSVTDSCTLLLNNNNGKKVLQKNFITRTIPLPVPTLGGLRDTTARISRMLVNPFLNVIFPGCYIRMSIMVTSFQATFIHDGDTTITSSNSNLLTPEQTNLLKKSGSNDKIYFGQIYGTAPDEKRRHLPSFWVKID